jgi:hypothetical protein
MTNPRCVVAVVWLGLAGCTVGEVEPPDEREPEAAEANGRVSWHAGTFRQLPSLEDDLASFVAALPHPRDGGYGTLSANRTTRFTAMLEAMFATIDDNRDDGARGDWCAVQALADDAGYQLYRFRDTATGRWFVYGRDRTPYGQAYFFVNPYAKRNLVVEAPHDPYDANTGAQAARVFAVLAAQVVIINKEHRCSDPDPTPCDGVTGACGGFYRESDVAHHTASTFHVLHAWLSDRDPGTRFVQLHGFTGGAADRAEISDGTRNDVDPGSIANVFAANLAARSPVPGAVHSCQAAAGDPPAGKCGSTNVQGRHTNDDAIDACTDGTTQSSGRFLHLEQDAKLRDADDTDGWSWQQIAEALHDTWPECSGDCTLGPRQTRYAGVACAP